jgi:hypothetical protein
LRRHASTQCPSLAEAPFQLITVLEVSGVSSFQDLEAVVALSFQDALRFRVSGDRRLIHLAIANCTE